MVTQPDETQAAISGEAQNMPPQDEPDDAAQPDEPDDAAPAAALKAATEEDEPVPDQPDEQDDSAPAAALKAATEEDEPVPDQPDEQDDSASAAALTAGTEEDEPVPDQPGEPDEPAQRPEPDADTILPPLERKDDDDHPAAAEAFLPPVERKDEDEHPEAAEAMLPPVEPKKAEVAEEEEGSRRDIPTEEEAFQEGRVWYIIHTYSGHENKVKTNLEHRTASMDAQDLIFRVVVPTEDEIEIREGQRRTVSRKIFPGYILVQMVELREDDADSTRAWFVVRNTPGVTGFVGSGTRPVPLEEEEVRRILRQMRVEEPRVKVGFAVGQNVRIVDGPFQDFVGQVDDLNLEKGKVKVLVSFFGRETPVELDFLQVEKL